ncbi:DUF222 domain-containing protein [Nocardioides sp. zg-536]|uniref:DUF222 domain-containing protein n=1 Tax=Nocardioides faecalis TaxID=2803858 RepID=A0A939BVP7_9ACTN|nr:HNH endonuclease signature motif containing protein [Nocardioides faecalis]MBM9460181.1 DUF222 domain-containing protein [Nocardioides faecalis]QVI60024.1 DUF222 domain-containing protein [Nocardioides faecalis]
MATSDKETALVELTHIEAQVAELRLRLLASADDVAAMHGARDAGAWIAHTTHTDPQTARADWRLAKALETRTVVAAGMRDGHVSAAQARVITLGLDELPTELAPETVAGAEVTLVGYCDEFGPKDLRRLARRILDVVAPEVADAEEGKKLQDEERHARERATLSLRDLGDGRTRLSGVLPTTVANRLRTYLDAYTSPRKNGGTGGVSTGSTTAIPRHRANAHAFEALLELLDPDQLPEHGGDATTVIVALSHEQLLTDLATAIAITGGGADPISAGEARRLACQAAIIPQVYGGDSELLDQGRAKRLFTKPQRKAMKVRDRRCRAEGCTITAAWTEAHHLRPWSQGGRTDLKDAVCFCKQDHLRAHDPSYEMTLLPNGDYRFTKRQCALPRPG